VEVSSLRPVADVGVRYRALRLARASSCVRGVVLAQPGRPGRPLRSMLGKCMLKPMAIFVVLSELLWSAILPSNATARQTDSRG
jgi:hypothetical protein